MARCWPAVLVLASASRAACLLPAGAPASFWRGKRVLLAGASSGLGEALARELSARGAQLALGARRVDRLEAIAAECTAADGPAHAVLPLDVTDSAEVLAADAARASAMLGGPIDVLCYTAGVGQRSSAVETSAAAHRTLMRTNFDGAVALTRALLPPMLERRSGAIVYVSSVQGFFGQPFRSSYAASKAALVGYTDAVRAEVGGQAVRVTLVAPGYIATDHAASALGAESGGASAVAPRGMPPQELAVRVADAAARGTAQLVASQLDGRVAMLLRTLWPAALFRIMRAKAAKNDQ